MQGGMGALFGLRVTPMNLQPISWSVSVLEPPYLT
jgi:hypothetical protein